MPTIFRKKDKFPFFAFSHYGKTDIGSLFKALGRQRDSERVIMEFSGFFWVMGMIYTGHNLIENFRQYRMYQTITISKYDQHGKLVRIIDRLYQLNSAQTYITMDRFCICRFEG